MQGRTLWRITSGRCGGDQWRRLPRWPPGRAAGPPHPTEPTLLWRRRRAAQPLPPTLPAASQARPPVVTRRSQVPPAQNLHPGPWDPAAV